MAYTHHDSTPVSERALLAVGFVAFTAAVLAAYASPATAYELSIYAGTPTAFWLLLGAAMAAALVVALGTETDWLRSLALTLGGAGGLAVVGLPILRGYRFYGRHDSLTHLGWAKEIQAGGIAPAELTYPGIHTVAALIGAVLGVDLAHALLLVVVLLAAVYVVFVALIVSFVADTRRSAAIGTFSAILFLPITNLSTYMLPHAMTQAIMFSPLLLYLLLRYASARGDPYSSSSLGALAAISSAAAVVYHPQLAAHALLVLVGICALQYYARAERADTPIGDSHPIVAHRPIYGQTALLAVAFLAWSSNRGFFVDELGYVARSTVSFLFDDGAAGASVLAQGGSLLSIGGSVAGVLLKLFGVNLLFGLLSIALVASALSDSSLDRDLDGVVSYFGAGLACLVAAFAVYFLGSISRMYFRAFGFAMVLVTVLGAVAVARALPALSSRIGSRPVDGLAAVGVGVVVVLSVAALFASPYFYHPNPHVTDAELTGHETAFEHQDEEVPFVGIRTGPDRFVDAIEGGKFLSRSGEGISGEQIDSGIAGQYEEDRYLVTTSADRQRELGAYDELRYTREQLDSIPHQRGVNRVHSTGEFELFYVRAEE